MSSQTDVEARLESLLLSWEDQREQGGTPTPETLCSDCPELIEPLRRRIVALEAMDRALDSQTDPGTTVEVDPMFSHSKSARSSARSVTTYSDLRFHAEGGLGEVYKARHPELGRDVALKFIKPNRLADPESRRRFLLEAEVTGRLEHPGIVPIHGLGRDERNQPCYAMRFIQGRTLQQAIAALHTAGQGPADRARELRSLLRRFVSVCNTIAYAHSKGVLHRDLKPRNILLGPFDETLVVDWGLAKDVDAANAETNTGATESASGSETHGVVGTPAYMSPEQAEANWPEVGPASDVYGLGATLYAILTGRAPVDGRHPGEVLEKVRRGRITPPRQVDPSIAKPLEAVCLKALARSPAGRYASALDLAADIEHWLADEPVTALPEPWTQRVGRWMKQHRNATLAAAASLLVVTVASLVSALLIDQARRGELRALNQTNTALAAETLAREDAQRQRQRAEEGERIATAAVKKFRDAIITNRDLKDRADLRPLRATLLKEPLAFFKALRDHLEAARDARPEAIERLAEAGFDLAGTAREIGDQEDALRAYQECLALRTRLVRDAPNDSDRRLDLARVHNGIGTLQQATGRRDEALDSYRQALTDFEQAARLDPNRLEVQAGIAHSHNNIGELEREAGHPTEALLSHREAGKLFQKLANAKPDDPGFQRDLAASDNNTGLLLREISQPEAALAAHQDALRVRERLAREDAANAESQVDLAASHNNIGDLEREAGQTAAALESYGLARTIFERLVHEHPTVTQFQEKLALSHHNIGNVESELNQPEAAMRSYTLALTSCERLARENPTVTALQFAPARIHDSIGLLQLRLNRRDDALASWRKALAILERLASANPAVSDYQRDLAISQVRIGTIQLAALQPDAARASFESARSIWEKLLSANPDSPDIHHQYGLTLANLSQISWGHGRVEEARALLEQGNAQQLRALAANPRNPVYRQFLSKGLMALSLTYFARSDPKGAAGVGRELAARMADAPEDLYNAALIFAHCIPLTMMPADRDRYAAEAIAALQAAVAAGWSDARLIIDNPEFRPLRHREDFQRLPLEIHDRDFPRNPFARETP